MIALADELLISVKTESVREAENIGNIRLNIISMGTKKIKINEHKSEFMAISRRKRKEKKKLQFTLTASFLKKFKKLNI